jgi:hypothetical protein
MIFTLFIILNARCFANNMNDINSYKNINNLYGKWKVVSYIFEDFGKTSDPCPKDTRDKYYHEYFDGEVGKIITISKELYEYPYDENLKSNYFVYNDKDLGDEKKLGGKRDYILFSDGKCEIKKIKFCYKIDNPIYQIHTETENLFEYDYIEKDIKELVDLQIYRKPEDYELPLDNDNEYVYQDSITFILGNNNKVTAYMGLANGRFILEKIK